MTDNDLIEWRIWFNKFVKPVFIAEGRSEYFEKLKKSQAPFFPDYSIAERFYETIKNDNRFDEELKLFFSFLYSCGFFMENIISFEEWLVMPNWWQPHLKDGSEKSILAIIEGDSQGLKYLKNRFRWLPFLSRPEGS